MVQSAFSDVCLNIPARRSAVRYRRARPEPLSEKYHVASGCVGYSLPPMISAQAEPGFLRTLAPRVILQRLTPSSVAIRRCGTP